MKKTVEVTYKNGKKVYLLHGNPLSSNIIYGKPEGEVYGLPAEDEHCMSFLNREVDRISNVGDQNIESVKVVSTDEVLVG